MKILAINYSDLSGGAARAAYRIHHAVRAAGGDSNMQVVKSTSGDWTVSCPAGYLPKLGSLLRPRIAFVARSFLKTSCLYPLSPSILRSSWPARINKSNVDLVHLHWLCAEMMSVEDIARIRKPLVWTLHDMWAFCGAEHYSKDSRWREGYTASNRPAGEAGFDLNRWVWKRKRKEWKNPTQIVTPSKWLSECVGESALMHDWPVKVIPNAINTDEWKPIEKDIARDFFNLPKDCNLIIFGAMGGGDSHLKGFDLLLKALEHLRGEIQNLVFVIFGQACPKEVPDIGFPIHYMGYFHDDLSLRALYSAADAMIIPSRMDNLPNTGVEAMACGTPVVAFNTCGLSDIITHKKTGWLATAFDTEDLAKGIQWVLADKSRQIQLGDTARAYAVANFSFPVVAEQYMALYENLLNNNK
ncbi:MAG: glycosyltransferase family 4 protein [Gammaproteobacteria bacterium]|nr:glycosyltransferase family 4 protein [Gammaproteobacteria bacterium]